jgi:O-antigen/teichoic acid export membrane protein
VLLGHQWEASVGLVRIVAFSGIALAPAFMTFPSLVAVGRVKDTFLACMISIPPSIGALVVAAWSGPTAVAIASVGAACLQMAVALWFVRRALGFRWRDLARATLASLWVTAATAVVPLVFVMVAPAGPALGITEGIIAGAGAALGWLVGLRLTGHPLCGEILRLLEPVSSRLRGRVLPVGAPPAGR